jgi:hypothetical protein
VKGFIVTVVKIKLLNGPYKNRSREIPTGFNREGLLHQFLDEGWRWKFDYSQATNDELLDFAKLDLTFRIMRAARECRMIIVGTFMFRRKEDDNVWVFCQEVEDCIVESEHMVQIIEDSDDKLEISLGDPE